MKEEKETNELVEKAYQEMLYKAKQVGFNENQMLYIMSLIIDTISPSLYDLQQQINELKKE